MYEQGRDPLKTSPEYTRRAVRLPKVEVSFSRYSIPYANYTRKTDRMGNFMLSKGLAIPLAQDVEKFLEDSIEKRNLAEIEEIYGSPALSFIAHLHALGLIGFT